MNKTECDHQFKWKQRQYAFIYSAFEASNTFDRSWDRCNRSGNVVECSVRKRNVETLGQRKKKQAENCPFVRHVHISNCLFLKKKRTIWTVTSPKFKSQLLWWYEGVLEPTGWVTNTSVTATIMLLQQHVPSRLHPCLFQQDNIERYSEPLDRPAYSPDLPPTGNLQRTMKGNIWWQGQRSSWSLTLNTNKSTLKMLTGVKKKGDGTQHSDYFFVLQASNSERGYVDKKVHQVELSMLSLYLIIFGFKTKLLLSDVLRIFHCVPTFSELQSLMFNNSSKNRVLTKIIVSSSDH